LLVIVVVAMVFLMGGDDEKGSPDTDTTARQDTPASEQPAQKPAEQPTAEPAEASEGSGAGAGDPDAPTEQGSTANEPDPQPTDASASTEKLPKDAPMWMRMKVSTAADIPDPKSFGEVPFDRLDAEKAEQAKTWAADYANGGRAGIDAENEMRKDENRYAAVFGLIDHLRTLNYLDSYETKQGYAINRLLTELTEGLQTGFVVADEDEIDPRKAAWNTNTVKTWLKLFDSYADQKAFDESCKERRAAAAKK
ncbi:MAG: hypothetical protein KDE27_29525, partial [Planctomycetes bacterium]|nr:hypothetical protein [Planctomycetota bacterium]